MLLAGGPLNTVPINQAWGVAANLQAAGTFTLSATADLTTSIPLAASASITLTGTAEITTSIALQASASLTLTGTAELTTAIPLAAEGEFTLTGVAELYEPKLAIAASATLTAWASLNTPIRSYGIARFIQSPYHPEAVQ
jgi:hypothetical protein